MHYKKLLKPGTEINKVENFLDFVAKYILLPVVSALGTLAWRMHIRMDERMTVLETRTNSTEKDLIEVRTEIRKDIQYLAQDVKEIKELLQKK